MRHDAGLKAAQSQAAAQLLRLLLQPPACPVVVWRACAGLLQVMLLLAPLVYFCCAGHLVDDSWD